MCNKKVTPCVVMMMLMVMLVGCGQPSETQKVNVACIFSGGIANTARASNDDIGKYVEKVCATYGYLSIIIPDGNPYIFSDIEVPEPDKNLTEAKREAIAKEYGKQILSLLDQAEAKTEEVDLLKAMEYGARSLSSQEDGEKYLVIFHSGLSTVGSIDFTKTYLETVDVEDMIEKLKDAYEIPNLKNVQVIWYNLGDVVKPQSPISNSNKEKLKEIWNAVLNEAGATSVEFKTDIPTNTEVLENLSYVTQVKEFVVTKEEEDSDDIEPIFVLDEYSIQFRPNEAELLTDSSEFLFLVDELVTYMKEHKEYKILLCGSTATGKSQESCIQLSKMRAEKIKELLLGTGILEEQIITIGLGFEHEFHINDLNEQGQLIEEQAKKNRAVIILEYDTEQANILFNNY